MASQPEIVSGMRKNLAITEPDLDTSTGSVTRKILDAVGEAISEAYIDQHLLTYSYDIDSKTEGDLDAFVALFGISRIPAKRATGTVTFSRSGAADKIIPIPVNFQLSNAGDPVVAVQTVTAAVMNVGDLSVNVPVQAVLAGPDGNIPPGTLYPLQPLESVATVINAAALTGGAGQETDSELRERWKKTVFRNMAGTECQPPGTQVLVPRNRRTVLGVQGSVKVALESVPIESLKVGDCVVSWRRGVPLKEGREITGITSTEYSGSLIVIRDESGRTSRYTPNHRCIAKLGPALEGKHIVYLQRRGTSFRIGTTTDRRVNGSGQVGNSSGIADRLASQGGEEAWILSVHEGKADALLAEAYASWHFGIPMTLFRANHARDGEGVQERLDTFWNKVGDLTPQAVTCLSAHGRMIEHPFIRRGVRKSWNRAGEVEACNLINGAELIDVGATLDDGATRYASVAVTTEFYEGPVWSMDVEEFHTYVADGFVTHNSMYLGIALNDPDCNAANVVGASRRRREQLQIVTGSATSTLAQAQYAYNGSQIVGRNLEAGDIAIPGVDYIWNTGVNPPRVDVLSAVALPDATLIDLEFDYVPKASRNDLVEKINNRIDVWCAGSRPMDATQTVVFRNTLTFNNTSGSQYLRTDYLRPDGSNPANSNVFIPLAWGPILTVPASVVVGGTTYGLATAANPLGTVSGGVTYAYQIVHHNTPFGWGPRSLFGLEWAASNLPANDTVFVLDYTFNAVPHAVQGEIDRWRLIGTDAMAHQAKNMFLKFNIAIIYDFNADQNVVNTAVDTALADYLSNLGLATVVQASDVLQVIHNTPGVDAVRFLHSGDVSSWNSATPNNFTVGIQRVVGTTVVQSYVDANGRVKDIVFADDEAPTFGLTYRSVRAQNSFGVT